MIIKKIKLLLFSITFFRHKVFRKLKDLSKKNVVKDYFSVAGANILLQPIQIIKGFFVASILGPADYGILKTVELVQMLNKFGNLGFKTVANREMSHAIGEKDFETVEKYRNTNYTAEIILSIMLSTIGIVSAFLFDDFKITLLVTLASISLFLSKIEALLKTETAIQKRFSLLSRNTIYTGLFLAIMVIVLVPFLKIFAIFIVNIITFCIGIFLYKKNLTFNFKFELNRKILKKSLKIGIPFTIATLVLGLYKYSERLLLIDFIDATALGFFSFALMISNSFSIIFKASIKVRLQDIWRFIGAKKFEKVNKMVMRESLILTSFSILIIPVIWVAVDVFVPIFLPKYVDAIPIVRISSFIIPFQVIANYAGAVITSKTINKVYFPVVLRLISLTVFAGGSYYFYYNKSLTLELYAYLNLAGYAFFNIGLVINYYISFRKNYINRNEYSI